MSLHMYLQIFPPPQSMFGHDGLYRVRGWVYALWFLIPNVSASLAFINRPYGYAAQGSFCYLPIRPYWLRLALSWVPRYFVWLFILWVALRIYRHVGREFKVFGIENNRSTSTSIDMSAQSSVERHMQAELLQNRIPEADGSGKGWSSERLEDGGVAPDEQFNVPGRSQSLCVSAALPDKSPRLSIARRPSAPAWSTPFAPLTNETLPTTTSCSNPNSRRGSRTVGVGIAAEDFAPVNFDSSLHRGSVGSIESRKSQTASQAEAYPGLATINESGAPIRDIQNVRASLGDNVANRALKQRRLAIQRQLRLLFIYPCVYMIMWLIPFISHCLNYSNEYASHPVFVLSMLSTLCQTLMGCTDVIVFSWRERPWRHISGSDGTFLGSFRWWRFCFQSVWKSNRYGQNHSDASIDLTADSRDQNGKAMGLRSAFQLVLPKSRSSTSSKRPSSTRPSSGRTHSRGSDRRQKEADQAYERLELERQEWAEKQKKFLENRRASIAGQNNQEKTKEWFDRRFSENLLLRDDGEVKEQQDDGSKREEH